MSDRRDWDKELAAIDKVISKTPPSQLTSAASAPAPAGGGGRSVNSSAGGPVTRRAKLGAWFRVGLGAALAVGMLRWPYAHACGSLLLLYGVAVLMVNVMGLWGVVVSWRRRMGLAHLISMLVMIWGLALAAATVLPRVGYAKTTASWLCPSSVSR